MVYFVNERKSYRHWCIWTLMDFFRETTFRLLGVQPPQIFTRAWDWPRLVSAHPRGTGAPENFNRENLTFGLKFRVLESITSGLVGVSSRNFFQSTCREAGVIICVQFLEGRPHKKIGRAKNRGKIWRDFSEPLTLIENISGMDQHIENRKSSWSSATPPTSNEEIGVLWSTYEKVTEPNIFTR